MPASSPDDESLLEIGRIGRPHGLAGEVSVSLVSNRPERLRPGSVLALRGPVGPGGASELTVSAARPHQNRMLVCFEGVASREAAEQLRGCSLYGSPIADPDALFVHELIGLEVVDVAGASHGPVAAVQANPASDLLVGEAGWLVPLRFVVERDEHRIVVDAPDGLFDE